MTVSSARHDVADEAFRTYNIVQLGDELAGGGLDRLAAVVERQQVMGSTDLVVMCSVLPEQLPLSAAPDRAAATIAAVRDAVGPHGIAVSALIQASMGHGERGAPRSPAPFQRLVDQRGVEHPAVFCQLDPGFVAHVADSITTIAAARPELIIIDDDVRLEQGSVWSCFCPMHLALFAAHLGRPVDREQLVALLAEPTEAGREARQAWEESELASTVSFVSAIRQAIDEVDPTLRAGICGTAWTRLRNRAAVEILAGAGQRPWFRSGGAVYLVGSPKSWPSRLDQVARQLALIDPGTETVIEADTFPHNAWSLSARGLRAWLTLGVLIGQHAAKAWVTPTAAWDGTVGALGGHLSAHRTVTDQAPVLRDLAAHTDWAGLTAPYEVQPRSDQPWNLTGPRQFLTPAWIDVVGRLGLPVVPGGAGGPIAVLDGAAAATLDDATCERLLAGPLLLDGGAAVVLTNRGYAPALGVFAEPGGDLRTDAEEFAALPDWNGPWCGLVGSTIHAAPNSLALLAPLGDDTTVLSRYVTRPYRGSAELTAVAPAVTVHENAQGGRIAVLAADLSLAPVPFHLVTAPRRRQLLQVASWLGGGRTWYAVDVDSDVLLLQGRHSSGADIVVVTNLNDDPLSQVPLLLPSAAAELGTVRIERLGDHGEWTTVPGDRGGEGVVVETSVAHLDVAVLRLIWG